MVLTFKGDPNVVSIGGRYLEPGDQVSDDPKSKTKLYCDPRSLEYLAGRGDFEQSKKKPAKKSAEVTNDG